MLKRSILAPVVVMLGLLLGVFLGAYYWEHQQMDRREMGNLLAQSRDIFRLNLRNDIARAQGLIAALTQSREIAAAFTARDRARLLAEVQPLRERLERQHHLAQLTFFEPDGTVFLRAHTPERFGDRIDRRPLRPVMSGEVVAAAFEVGAADRLMLRVAVPWQLEGRLLGFVEMAETADWLLDQLRQSTRAEFALLLTDPPRRDGPPIDWPRIGEHYLVATTLKGSYQSAAELCRRAQGAADGEFELEGRTLHQGAIDVEGPEGEPLGRLLVLNDVTTRHQAANRTLLLAALAGLLVAIALAAFFGRLIGRVEREVELARSGLEKAVTERTADLLRESGERKAAQEQLMLLSRAIEQSPAAVMITDYSGNIEYVNPRFCEVTGYSVWEASGRNPRFLKSGEQSEEEYQRMWEELRAGRDWRGEFRNLRKDGSRLLLSASISPVRAPDGQIRHFVAVSEDITTRREGEERLRRHQEELAHMDRLSLLGEMAAALAHEVKQPLSTIVNFAGGCIQRIRAGNTEPHALLFALQKITEQGKLAGDVVRKIREFVSKGEPEMVPTDINQLVRQSLELVQTEARHGGVRVELALAPALPPTLADPIQVRQVLLNLMLNAVQALAGVAPERRQLTIRTARPEGDGVLVTVEDWGPGLPDAEINKLFQPFFTTKPGGMGMGLAICRSIVEAHGGEITAAMNAQGGLSFSFTLPTVMCEQNHAA